MIASLDPPYDFLLILLNKTVYKGYLFYYFLHNDWKNT